MTVNELPQARPHEGAARADGTVLAAELAGLLHAGGGVLAVIGLVIPSLRPVHLGAGATVAVAAIIVGAAYHLTRNWAWSDVALRWAVVGSGLTLITAYNLATAAEPFRYSVFYFFLLVWIGLTQPRGTSLWTMPLVAVSYLVPIAIHDDTPAALLSILFIAPTLAVAGELIGWFSAQRTSLRQQLEAAVGELQRHDERRDLFIDTASHELRNPLATIRGSVSTLQQRRGQLSEEDTARLVGMLHHQVDRMQRMVDDLLTSSRIRSGVLTHEPRAVALDAELRALLTPSTLEAVEVDEEALAGQVAWVDPDHLAQVLTNLVDNARRYGKPPIRVTAEAGEDTVTVHVADHGPGVPEDQVEELFREYGHGGQTTGLGLGLHIVRELVERNGGSVDLHDNDGQGACFCVQLPAAGDDATGRDE